MASMRAHLRRLLLGMLLVLVTSEIRAQDTGSAALPGTVAPVSGAPAAPVTLPTTVAPVTLPTTVAPVTLPTTVAPSTAPTAAPVATTTAPSPAPAATTLAPSPAPAATTLAPLPVIMTTPPVATLIAPAPAPAPSAAAPTPAPIATPAPATGGPATGGPATGGPATGGPATGGPATGGPPTAANGTGINVVPAAASPAPAPATTVPALAPTPSPVTPSPPTEAPTTPVPSATPLVTPTPVSVSPPPPVEPPAAVTPTPASSAPPANETPAPAATTTAPAPAATTTPPTAEPTPAPESPPPPTQPVNAVTRAPATTAPTPSATPEPKPSPLETTVPDPTPTARSAFSPVASNGDNAKVSPPDLSTLEPIIEGETSGANGSKKKTSDSASTAILNDTKSGAQGESTIGGMNLVLIGVGIVGAVLASLFFVRTRQRRNSSLQNKRDSSQQRALDAFFEQNASTTAAGGAGACRSTRSNSRGNSSMLQRQTTGRILSNGDTQLTPASEIALASFISRSTGRTTALNAAGATAAPAVSSSAGLQKGRFDDTLLRGTAAFQMNGPLPPSPRGSAEERESARSTNDSRYDVSFVSDASSDFSTLKPSETSVVGEGFYESEVDGSEIGDFRSTGGVQSMYSSGTSSLYMKPSFASSTSDYRPSDTSSLVSSVAMSNHPNLRRTASHESIGSSNGSSSGEEFDESAFNTFIASNLLDGGGPVDDMWRVSELSEGEI